MPSPRPDIVVTTPDTPVIVRVLDNDTGSALVLVAFDMPAAGRLALRPDQSLTYTPDPGFVGTDGFTYTVRDAAGDTASASVTVIVNAPPVAVADMAATAAGAAVDIPVLANDNDPEGEGLVLTSVLAPLHGSIEASVDGVVRYRPGAGFAGEDSFSYTVADPAGGTATAAVTVAVSGVNRPPEAWPDALATAPGVPVTFDPLANDSDPDGGRLGLAAYTLPGQGSLAVDARGLVTYQPADGFAGQDSFTYLVTDELGAVATGGVTVDVVPPNRPPTAVDDAATTPAGMPVSLDPVANDNDPDGQPLALAGLTPPQHGSLVLGQGSTVVYTPDPGFAGIDGFDYTVTDSAGATDTASVAIEVLPPTYANGYRYRRLLRVAAASGIDGPFPLVVATTLDDLRSIDHGGSVASPAGDDIRFETVTGSKIPHMLEAYDAAVGSLAATLRAGLAGATDLHLYYGRTAPGLPEAEPAAATTDLLARWHAASGADLTGRGRGLSSVALTPGAAIGVPTALYNGTTSVMAGAADWLVGLPALHLHCVVQAGAAGSNRGILRYGQGTLGDGSAGGGTGTQKVLLRWSTLGARGGQANVIVFAVGVVKADGSKWIARLESAANRQTTAPMVIDAFWSSGSLPELWIDGSRETPSWVGAVTPAGTGAAANAVLTGTIDGAAGDLLEIGGGNDTASARRWAGTIGNVEIRTPPAPAIVPLRAVNLADPQLFHAIGGTDTVDAADRPPLALPDTVTTRANTATVVNVIGNDVGPDGGTLTVVATDTISNGAAAVSANKIVFTPAAGFTGDASLFYTVRDPAGRTSRAKVRVRVESNPLAGNLPYFGTGFGCDRFCINAGNRQIKSATLALGYSFKVLKTGTLTQVMFEIATNQNDDELVNAKKSKGIGPLDITYRLSRGQAPGSAGSGGTVSIPGTLIRSGTLTIQRGSNGKNGDLRRWVKVATNGTAPAAGIPVTAGEYLHLYFLNPHPDPANNYVSINAPTRYITDARESFAPLNGTPPRVISVPAGDHQAWQMAENSPNLFNRMPGHMPQITQFYLDGDKIGPCYRFGESGLMNLATVGGNAKVRQRWRHIYPTTVVDRVWLYCHWPKAAGLPSGPLNVRVTEEAGSWGAGWTKNVNMAPSPNTAGGGGADQVMCWSEGIDGTYAWWSHADFAAIGGLPFTQGRVYEIRMSSTSPLTRPYKLHPIQAFIRLGASDDDTASDGWLWYEDPTGPGQQSFAQYSTTSPESWKGFYIPAYGETAASQHRDISLSVWLQRR